LSRAPKHKETLASDLSREHLINRVLAPEECLF
jgi:hypothetical protein